MITSLSPSKLTSFKDCPRAFKYASIDKLPESSSRHLVLGTFVHLALEKLYSQRQGRRKDRAEGCLWGAWAEIREDPDYLSLELDTLDVVSFCAEAQHLLNNALRLEDPDSVLVHSTEQTLEAEVDGVMYRGIIDRIDWLPDGKFGVVDYKTGRVPDVTKERGKLEGVYFYALLCEQVYGQRPEWVRLDYLATPVSVTCVPTEQSVRGLRGRAGAVWAAIETGDFQPRQSPLCNWCAYKALCPLFGGDEDT